MSHDQETPNPGHVPIAVVVIVTILGVLAILAIVLSRCVVRTGASLETAGDTTTISELNTGRIITFQRLAGVDSSMCVSVDGEHICREPYHHVGLEDDTILLNFWPSYVDVNWNTHWRWQD